MSTNPILNLIAPKGIACLIAGLRFNESVGEPPTPELTEGRAELQETLTNMMGAKQGEELVDQMYTHLYTKVVANPILDRITPTGIACLIADLRFSASVDSELSVDEDLNELQTLLTCMMEDDEADELVQKMYRTLYGTELEAAA